MLFILPLVAIIIIFVLLVFFRESKYSFLLIVTQVGMVFLLSPLLVALWRSFYPIMKRVWCRFVAMAAILGLQQRLFSKFRIYCVNGISCGIVLAEMGIDVRSYAQKKGTFFLCRLRYMCSQCPLEIENDTPAGRINSNEIRETMLI
jgi:uncharacterized membrane protein YoaK (UPF0700 family)